MNIPPGADTRPILTESMFQAICVAGGWAPTPRRRGGLTTWAPLEGTPVWIFNPFATEEPDIPGQVARSAWDLGLGDGPGKWNHDGKYGVGIYATEADGARATVNTIRQVPPLFSFKPIADWIDADCVIPDDATRGALVANMIAWGTGGFATLISHGWQAPSINADGSAASTPPAAPVPAFTEAQVAAVKGLIDGSFGPILLSLLRQMLGLDASTWSSTFQPSIEQVKAALTGITVPSHVHEPSEGLTGGVHR